MPEDKRIKRLDEISAELFKMANEFALEKKPGVAVFLHESVNNIRNAQENFELNHNKIPVELVERSCGLGMGTTMADLILKDDLYAADLEKEKKENG
jgi:hypothetical protein